MPFLAAARAPPCGNQGKARSLRLRLLGRNSARRVVRIAKERIVWEPVYPICIHVSRYIIGHLSL